MTLLTFLDPDTLDTPLFSIKSKLFVRFFSVFCFCILSPPPIAVMKNDGCCPVGNNATSQVLINTYCDVSMQY